jgi:hypothetical protein
MKRIDGIYKQEDIKRIDGPHRPKKIKNLTFEELLAATMPQIEYLSRMSDGLIKSYDPDDIVQELSIKLWNIYRNKKLPADMIYLDFRYMRFVEKCFKRRILDIQKMTYERSKRAERSLRDIFDRSIPFPEGNDDIFAKPE